MTDRRRSTPNPPQGTASARATESVKPAEEADGAVPERWLQQFETHAREVDEYNHRLLADAELLGVLQFGGFQGPAWHELATALAEYGYQVIRAWIRSGYIYVLCARRRISLSSIMASDRPEPAEQDVEELTQDTVSSAIERFRTEVLIPRKWDPRGGATLKTYFIGQALFRFGDEFRLWARRKRAAGTADSLDTPAGLAVPSALVAPDQLVEGGERVAHLLGRADKTTRAILVLSAQGYEQIEIAEMLGLSARAVEGRLYRYRKRLEARHAVA